MNDLYKAKGTVECDERHVVFKVRGTVEYDERHV